MSDEIDLDLPPGNSLEEKGAHVMEQLRTFFFQKKKQYLDDREGGRRHGALRCLHPEEVMVGHEIATEHNFVQYLKDALLDKDGNTTDPKYPTNKMIGHEQRRIREFLILTVHQFMARVESMMPDDTKEWTEAELYFNLMPFVYRYEAGIHEELKVVIPGTHQPPPSTYRVGEQLQTMATRYTRDMVTHNYGKAWIIDRMRDELMEYLLGGIPYNPWVLVPKTELIADEQLPKEPPPVLH